MDTTASPQSQPVATPSSVEPKTYHGLSVAGLSLGMMLPPIGFIISIVALVKTKKHHQPSRMALVGVIVGGIMALVEIGCFVIIMVTVVSSAADSPVTFTEHQAAWSECLSQDSAGTITLDTDGSTWQCGQADIKQLSPAKW